MTPGYQRRSNAPVLEDVDCTLYQGDALDVLSDLPDASVDCCVTSPPYWGLRDYGHADQLGLESTPGRYVERLVAIFSQVRRVLVPTGTLWLNLGDSYAGSWGAQSRPNGSDIKRTLEGGSMLSARQIEAHPRGTHTGSLKNTPGLKPKDLVGVPWRVAFALQDDGWWLRSEIIWHKPAPMPESIKDRPTKAHEQIFLLAKASRYFYDSEAIKEPSVDPESLNGRNPRNFDAATTTDPDGMFRYRKGFSAIEVGRTYPTRNARSVWTINPQPFPGAHFATFPEELARRCIVAGCPEMVHGGCSGDPELCGPDTCRPGTVLDPFMGSGTVAHVARKLGRRSVGIDLSDAYLKLASARMAQQSLLAEAL